LNSLEVDSPPRRDIKALISKPFSFSTRALKFLKASNFCLRNYTYIFLLKSSMKNEYLFLLNKGGLIGRHTSIYTSCGLVAIDATTFANFFLYAFQEDTLHIIDQDC